MKDLVVLRSAIIGGIESDEFEQSTTLIIKRSRSDEVFGAVNKGAVDIPPLKCVTASSEFAASGEFLKRHDHPMARRNRDSISPSQLTQPPVRILAINRKG